MIKAEHDEKKFPGKTIFNLYCDVCGKRIKKIADGMVQFEDFENGTTDKVWICHMKKCSEYIERKHGVSNWWHLDWLLKDLLLSFNDIKVSGSNTMDGFPRGETTSIKRED